MSLLSMAGGATGTGTVTLLAPVTNTDRTLTLPDVTGTVLTNATTTGFPAGSVLQVVTGTTSTAVTNSTSTYADVGLSATITPTSSSSKILVLTNIMGIAKTSTTQASRMDLKLLRGASELDDSGANLYTAGTNINLRISWSHSYYDSPATTSATTYKWQFRNAENTASVTVQSDGNAGRSQITLMEIAA